jgi:prepilin-type N-terminal cleavage/methylation domain-containing protein
MKFQRSFAAFRAYKNKGFSLIEIICAIVILVLVIFVTFSVLNYALKITVASRNRMNAFATAERTAVATLALRQDVSDPRVDSSRATINGILSINGVDRPVAMEAFTYKEKSSARLDLLMKSPVFIVFLQK